MNISKATLFELEDGARIEIETSRGGYSEEESKGEWQSADITLVTPDGFRYVFVTIDVSETGRVDVLEFNTENEKPVFETTLYIAGDPI